MAVERSLTEAGKGALVIWGGTRRTGRRLLTGLLAAALSAAQGGARARMPEAPATVPVQAQSHGECQTEEGLEERLLEAARRRDALLGPPLSLEAPIPEAESTSRLAQILGSDGNIERGNVVDVGGVVVLVDDGTGIFGSVVNGFILDPVRLARQYFAALPDDIDTLSLLPNFDHNSGTFHVMVRNDVRGINRSLTDDTAAYGSAGRLQSVLMFSNFMRRPSNPAQRITGDNNTALSLMAHEFAHRFGAFVRVDADPGPGVQITTDLLGRGNAHWCFFHDSRSAFAFAASNPPGMSSLEGNRWTQNFNGTWTNSGSTDGYSPLDLYLMGLLAPEEVPPFFVLQNVTYPDGGPSATCSSSPISVPSQIPRTLGATRRDFTLDDVIRVEGPRIPDVAASQKAFRQALTVVARRGRFPSPEEVSRIQLLRTEWEPYFAAATGGRASVDTSRPVPPGPAAAFAFVRLPDGVQAGVPSRLALLALDSDGRVATGYRGTVQVTSPTDPGASLPAPVVFDAPARGFLAVPEPVVFATAGLHTLTATDVADPSLAGSRSGIPVEAPVARTCIPGDPSPIQTHTRPWGVGATFSGVGGLRFQYLIRADAIGRPAMITNLDWPVFGGPDGVQWEALSIKMASKPEFRLRTQAGEPDLDRNFTESLDVTTVMLGAREQRGIQEAGRVHMSLEPPFPYNGVDHLLVEVRYTGGGPPGLLHDRVPGGGVLLTAERLGPNFPVAVDQTTTLCVGMRLPAGPPPVLSEVMADQIKNQTARVSWRTSPATDGRVMYGLAGGPLDQTTSLQRFDLTHAFTLQGLAPGTDYQFKVVSRDYDNQESRSAVMSFTTTLFSPEIFTIQPATLPPASPNTLLRLTGAHFFTGVTAQIVPPDLSGPLPPAPDPLVQVIAVSRISEGVLDLGISIPSNAPSGPRRIRVINPDGFDTYSSAFFGVQAPLSATDVDGSGRVDGFDLARLSLAFGAIFPDPRYQLGVDLDGSGAIDGIDLAIMASQFGRNQGF